MHICYLWCAFCAKKLSKLCINKKYNRYEKIGFINNDYCVTFYRL